MVGSGRDAGHSRPEVPVPKSRKSPLEARKRPSQARSRQLVDDVLQAAIRVLTREGAAAFNTIRVAEVAGVSVGSLYQYFPNRESLLFAIQEAEWQATFGALEAVLLDPALAPLERLRAAVVVFFETENEESDLRRALNSMEAADTQSAALRERAHLRMMDFLGALAPRLTRDELRFHSSFVMTLISATAERATQVRLKPAALDRWAQATAALVVQHLETLIAPND
jgi:AcrR family transcriptional regulator